MNNFQHSKTLLSEESKAKLEAKINSGVRTSVFIENGKKGLKDQSGNVVIEAIYDRIEDFEYGFTWVGRYCNYNQGCEFCLITYDNIQITPLFKWKHVIREDLSYFEGVRWST